jgi:hypothetical protein
LKFQIEHRSERSLFFKIPYKIIQSRFFNATITISILLNTLVLSLDRHPIDEDEAKILENLNIVFSLLFIIEMIVKLLGLGFKSYFSDSYNAFDCVIVVSTTVDLFISNLLTYDNEGSAITAFRAFRLLRVFKIAKTWR